MKNDKPARLLERLIATTAQQADRIKVLESEIVAFPERLERACDAAALKERANASYALRAAASDMAVIRAQLSDANERASAMTRELDDTRVQLDAAHRIARDAEAAAASARDQLASIATRERVMAEREAALRELIDRHEGRMRRRERDEANAILNRAAIRNLMPGGRR